MAESRRRPLTEVVVAVGLIAVSAVLFGWTTLGWWQPADPPVFSGQSSLVLYSNDPEAVVSGLLAISDDGTGGTMASLKLDFAVAADRSQRFRWALVGENEFAFDATMPSVNGDGGRRWHDAVPASRSTACGGGGPLGDTTVLLGGSSAARLAGTEGYEPVRAGTVLVSLRFPEIRPLRDGTRYTYSLGAVGRPTAEGDNVVQLGPLTYQRVPDCVDLGAGVGELRAHPVGWNVLINPVHPGDELTSTNARADRPGTAWWSTVDLVWPKAVFEDEAMVLLHQSSLFLGGLAAGIGTNFLVQGITGLTAPRRRDGASGAPSR